MLVGHILDNWTLETYVLSHINSYNNFSTLTKIYDTTFTILISVFALENIRTDRQKKKCTVYNENLGRQDFFSLISVIIKINIYWVPNEKLFRGPCKWKIWGLQFAYCFTKEVVDRFLSYFSILFDCVACGVKWGWIEVVILEKWGRRE